jgi:hypothetical protein
VTFFLTSVGGLVLAILGFLFGRVFNQSEQILSEKRRIYEEFLRVCPRPNEAYENWGDISEPDHPMNRFQRLQAPLCLYASTSVTLAVGAYIQAFGEASEILGATREELHPAFTKASKAHNDIVIEMRRDAFSWSAFAHTGPSRLPNDALEKAKRITQ